MCEAGVESLESGHPVAVEMVDRASIVGPDDEDRPRSHPVPSRLQLLEFPRVVADLGYE